MSSLLLCEHACQVENWLATEPDTVGVVNDLALVILRSERLVRLTLLHQMLLLLMLLGVWRELAFLGLWHLLFIWLLEGLQVLTHIPDLLLVLQDCIGKCVTGGRGIIERVRVSDYVNAREVLIALAALAPLVLFVHFIDLLCNLGGLGSVQRARSLWAVHRSALITELVFDDINWVVACVAAEPIRKLAILILVYRWNLCP